MRVIVMFALGFCVSSSAQTNSGLAELFHNGRLKLLSLPDRPVDGDSHHRIVDGVWVSESSGPDKQLVFPQQVEIECENWASDSRKCVEFGVTLSPTKAVVGIGELYKNEYGIDRWDDQGLIASYGGEELDSACQRHVLTMHFASGAVSVSDIPTHTEGCEALKVTNSYRLVRGEYYVDTTPNNDADADKPIRKAPTSPRN